MKPTLISRSLYLNPLSTAPFFNTPIFRGPEHRPATIEHPLPSFVSHHQPKTPHMSLLSFKINQAAAPAEHATFLIGVSFFHKTFIAGLDRNGPGRRSVVENTWHLQERCLGNFPPVPHVKIPFQSLLVIDWIAFHHENRTNGLTFEE